MASIVVEVLSIVERHCPDIFKDGFSFAQAYFLFSRMHSQWPYRIVVGMDDALGASSIGHDILPVPLLEKVVQGLLLCTEWSKKLAHGLF